MTRAGIIGYGVLGRQIEQMLGVESAVRFDDTLTGARPFAEHHGAEHAALDFYCGLGYKHLGTREAILARLAGLGRRLPPLVHPTAWVDPTARIEAGAIIFPRCVIGAAVVVGAGAILHASVTLAHDIEIGASAYLAPGVVVSGFVTLGARTFAGTGTVIANGVTIGADVKLGIGTCVTRDVPAGASAIGNPMRVLAAPLVLT